MAKTDAWDPKIKVEANAYNWKVAPAIRYLGPLPVDDMRPTMVDLFSGCGGFSVGFESAGFRSVLGLDIHPPSLDTYAHNHPSTSTIIGDIRKVSLDLIRQATRVSAIDVLTAGVPCQGFSRSNRKRHEKDERNFLFQEFIRVSAELKPTFVVLENVSGLVTTANGAFKDAISSAIEALGYDVHVRMLDASNYGVPQRRQRIFFVGVPRGARWAWPRRRFGVNGVPPYSVADAIADLPRLAAGQTIRNYSKDPRTELQSILRGGQGELLNHTAPDHPPETIARIAATVPGKPMYPDFKQRIRLDPSRPSPTQICGGIRPQFQFGHPTQARGLSVRERARIQSFPDRFYFHGGTVQGRVQTGNAVPPFLAEAIGAQLMRIINGKDLDSDPDELRMSVQEELFGKRLSL